MNSERKLPQIDVAGTKFQVDAVKMELIQSDNPNNRIGLLDMMTLDDHHEFLFDKETKNIKPDNWNDRNDPRYEYVWIRRMEALDPEGMRSLPFVQMAEQNMKVFPVADIAGTPFYWHDAMTEFLQVDNLWNRISKSDGTKLDGKPGFYFDTQQKCVPFPHEMDRYKAGTNLPPHIKFVDLKLVLQDMRNQLSKVNDDLLPKLKQSSNNKSKHL